MCVMRCFFNYDVVNLKRFLFKIFSNFCVFPIFSTRNIERRKGYFIKFGVKVILIS